MEQDMSIIANQLPQIEVVQKVETNFDAFKGYKVIRAKLHQSAPIPLHGETESLYAAKVEGVGKAALTNVEMKFDGIILMCRYKGKEFGFPAANVSVFFL